MIKELWLNLPVKNIEESRDFFLEIGFNTNPSPGNSAHSASLLIGSKNIVLMLFQEEVFQSFTGIEINDTSKSSEVLFSIGAESRAEVDEMAEKVVAAGGTIYSKASEVQSWMYSVGFADLDGHRWNMLYMDK